MLTIGLRSTLAELYLDKTVKIGIKKDAALEWCMILLFTYLSWNVGGWLGTVGYILIYALYVMIDCYIEKNEYKLKTRVIEKRNGEKTS